jgi:hypothetical protein
MSPVLCQPKDPSRHDRQAGTTACEHVDALRKECVGRSVCRSLVEVKHQGPFAWTHFSVMVWRNGGQKCRKVREGGSHSPIIRRATHKKHLA